MSETTTLFGIPVVSDDTMTPGTIEIRVGDRVYRVTSVALSIPPETSQPASPEE